MSVVLDEIKFRFLKLLGGFLLIFVVFDDMGYDKGRLMDEIGFWVDFVRGLGDLERLVFRVGVWTNQLIVIPGNTRLLLVFATPYTLKTTVFLHFSVDYRTYV